MQMYKQSKLYSFRFISKKKENEVKVNVRVLAELFTALLMLAFLLTS